MWKPSTTSLLQEAICEHWFRKAEEVINVDGSLGNTEEWEQSLKQILVGRIVYLLLKGFSEVVVRRTHQNRNPLIRNVIIACVGIWVLTD